MTPKIFTTMRTYDRHLFAGDLIAGVTVAMVALPLSLAIAIASGAEPAKGLVTAIVAGFLISFLGGSRVQIGGPTGAFIVVVFGIIAQHGYDGLVLATLMAGGILLISGLLRLGNLVAYVPEPVVNGFTIGIGLIIATSQIKDLLGLSIDKVPAEFIAKTASIWAARGSLNLASCAIGVGTIVLIVGLRRIAPKFPGLIVAVSLTSAEASNLSTVNWTFTQTVIDGLRGDGLMDDDSDRRVDLGELRARVASEMKYREKQRSGFHARGVSERAVLATAEPAERGTGPFAAGSYVLASWGKSERIAEVRRAGRKQSEVRFYLYNHSEDQTLDNAGVGPLRFRKYPKGAKLKVTWGGKLWDAVVLKTDGEFHYITYPGWPSYWDEWVMSDRISP